MAIAVRHRAPCLGDSAYKIMSTSSCPTGWEPVTDVTECNYAAQEVSLPRTNAQETQRSDWPRGCFWLQSYGGWLYWDEDGTEGEPGSQYQAVCEKIGEKRSLRALCRAESALCRALRRPRDKQSRGRALVWTVIDFDSS